MEKKQLREQFGIRLGRLDNLRFESLLKSHLGTKSITIYKEVLVDILQRLKKSEKNSQRISTENISKLIVITNEYIKIARNSDWTDEIYLENRDSFVGEIENFIESYLSIWPFVSPTLHEIEIHELGQISSENYKKIYDDTQERVTEITEIRDKLNKEYEDFRERYDPLITKAEILTQSSQFSTHAIKLLKESHIWIIATGVSILVFIATIAIIYKWLPIEFIKSKEYINECKECGEKMVNYAIVKNVGIRIILLSFVTFIVGFCIKNYNSCKHNYTLNLHKANSLFAALQLLDRAKTESGNDNLMIQASNAIFSHQPTGYNKKDPENLISNLIDHTTTLVGKKD